jgi:hypothetical protein
VDVWRITVQIVICDIWGIPNSQMVDACGHLRCPQLALLVSYFGEHQGRSPDKQIYPGLSRAKHISVNIKGYLEPTTLKRLGTIEIRTIWCTGDLNTKLLVQKLYPVMCTSTDTNHR